MGFPKAERVVMVMLATRVGEALVAKVVAVWGSCNYHAPCLPSQLPLFLTIPHCCHPKHVVSILLVLHLNCTTSSANSYSHVVDRMPACAFVMESAQQLAFLCVI